MSVASGAAARVDRGLDTSTTWTPAGLRRKPKPANRNVDSYLHRYQVLQQSKKNKGNVSQDGTDQSNHPENDGAKEEGPAKTGGGEDNASGKPSSGERSEKSCLCVLL